MERTAPTEPYPLGSFLPDRWQPVQAGAERATAKRLGLDRLAPVWPT
jgi:hypothetical protein